MNKIIENINPNHLLNEKSPYLLQHAYNPVAWYPWSEEAFEIARKENKPIFLSIGYSTCHWCHVMAHESFENPTVAELMNEVFISIKVDREERPDIDNIYMTVCQMLTGSGGWPLTILMTADKKPFFAGTYFPKETRFGRIGLIDLIKRIKNMWNKQKEDLLDSAEKITFSLKNLTYEAPGEKFNDKLLKNAFNQLSLSFDKIKGGFSNRPKFPTPHNLIFLLRFWKRTGNKDALKMVEKTLQAMRYGGIYDHIGFGIHRYSTDSYWLVPHFEKMLYDQALVAMAYIEAFQSTKKFLYKTTAQEIFTYVLRDMTSHEGGFYSAEDADSEGEEGKFYLWSIKELEDIFDEDLFEIVKEVYNLQNSGNYLEESTHTKTGNNILYLQDSITEISKKLPISEQELRVKLDFIRNKLFKIRQKRVHPHKDDKILTDWNGLMIAALAKGAHSLGNHSYLDSAKDAVEFIISKLRKPDGKLLHRYRDGKAEIEGFLTDYAFLIWGLIELYEATFEVKYLKLAIELNNIEIKDFWDIHRGGFYFTSGYNEELLTRRKEIYDGAIPSGNSVAMLNLLRLSYLTGDIELEKKADILSRVFSERLNSNPIAYTQFLVAADFAVGPSYSLVIAGDSDSKDTKELINAIRNEFIPNKVFILRRTEQSLPDIDSFSNFVEYFYNKDNKATAYVCINKTCKPPTHDIKKTIEYLKTKW
ncbi:MAG: thioredoxin domain-containing protein [Promethearchaeota archaeon]